VPLVLLGVVGGIGHAAAAGVAVHRAALEVRHAAAADDAGGASGDDAKAVTATLDRMNAAFAGRNLAGYLAELGPDAGLRTRQTATFRAMSRLPFAQVKYAWTPGQRSVPDGLTAKYRDESAFVAVVQRRYWLRGWDAAPTSELVALTFARHAGRWVVVGDADGKGALPAGVVPEPWTLGDVSVLTTKHVLLVGDRAAARQADLRRLADRVEDAVTGVRSLWSSKTWNGRVVVYALTDSDFVSPWFGEQAADGQRNDAGDAAEFDAEVVPMEATTMDGSQPRESLAGMRMVIAPTVLDYPTAQARAVIRHELTHLATLRLGEEAPAWLTEGIAEYTAYRVNGSSGKADGVGALDRRGLPKPMWAALRKSSYRPELVPAHDAFYGGSGAAVSRRYTDGWLAALYIADEFGETRLREFVEKASDPKQPTVDAREKAALASVLRTDRASFIADVGAYARELRSHFV
jgi:ribosome modulation factor